MKSIRLLLTVLFLGLLAQHSRAGFITGYIVGSSGKGSVQTSVSGSDLIAADGNDVLSCKKRYDGWCNNGTVSGATPEDYARKMGYSKVIRRGVVISGSDEYIIMEVAK